MDKSKRGLGVITTVLLILISIAAVSIVFFVIMGFLNNFNGDISNSSPFKKSFVIQPLTGDDIAYDRFRLTNTGQINFTQYDVIIDDIHYGLKFHRTIQPGESEFLYLYNSYPVGKHTLSVISSGYNRMIDIDVPEEWHVIIQNASVG